MTIKTLPINQTRTNPTRIFVIGSLISAASLSLVYGLSRLEEDKLSNSTYVDIPTAYAIKSLQITGPSTGTATIILDDFILSVGFDFETYEDNYGVPGTKFTNATVTNLSVEKIVSISGTQYPDFTDHTDHYQINAMIIGHILQHHLVEGM